MAAGHVATVAHARHADLEQLRIVGSVRLMAGRAIFHDGRVFPQERPFAFHMAAQTVRRDGRLNQLLRIGRPVRIVATGAGYLTFAIRHVRRPL